MTTTATNTGAEIPGHAIFPVRLWIAVAAAAIVFAVGLLGVLPFILALPVIGVVLALGSPPDYVGAPRPVAYRPRNQLLGVALGAALARRIRAWSGRFRTPLPRAATSRTARNEPAGHCRDDLPCRPAVSVYRPPVDAVTVGNESWPTAVDPRRGDFVRPTR
jgi:hypothetical protein